MQKETEINLQYEKELRFLLMKALGWYFRYNSDAQCKQNVIAGKLHYSNSRISQLIIPPKIAPEFTSSNFESVLKTKNKSLISLNAAKNICRVMNTSIASVLCMYLMCEDQDKTMGILPIVEKLKYLKSVLDDSQEAPAQAQAGSQMPLPNPGDEPDIITNIFDTRFKPWAGKELYCYFYSTSSEEIASMQKGKPLFQRDGPTPNFDDIDEETKYQKLRSLSTGEAIFCGILETGDHSDSLDGLCHVSLSFLSDISKKAKVYRGTLSMSAKTTAVYCELVGENLGDKAYFITDNPDIVSENPEISCCMAMVLTYSSRVGHRRPCAERMVISRTPICPGTPEYEEMKANLRMNDKIIRIDEDGYSHLIGSISGIDDADLTAIRQAYPNFDSLKSGYGKMEQVLHIGEEDIGKLARNLNENQQIIFKRLLRLHSLAPFYSKTKAAKSEDLLRERHGDSLYGRQSSCK